MPPPRASLHKGANRAVLNGTAQRLLRCCWTKTPRSMARMTTARRRSRGQKPTTFIDVHAASPAHAAGGCPCLPESGGPSVCCNPRLGS